MSDEFFAQRLAQLRMIKGTSARDMSLSIGQSDSYINKIENGKAFPSMQSFFYICEFLGVTPHEFFSESISNPVATNEAIELLEKLDEQQFDNVMNIIKGLTKGM